MNSIAILEDWTVCSTEDPAGRRRLTLWLNLPGSPQAVRIASGKNLRQLVVTWEQPEELSGFNPAIREPSDLDALPAVQRR